MAKGRLEPRIFPSGETQDILKKDISVPSDATRVSVQPRKVEEPKKVEKPKETGVSSNAFTQLPAPLQIVRAIGWGISSGRKQRAVEEAFLSGVDTGGGVSPSNVEKARKGELGPLDFRTLSQRAWVEPGTPEERIAAGKAVEEAIARAEASPMPLARRQALAALEKGASKELVLAVLSDPIGVLGFEAAESLARSPEAAVFSLFHRFGSTFGSFDAEQRSGFVNEIRKEMGRRGLDPNTPDDVVRILSDGDALNKALEIATKGATALAGTELAIDIGTSALAKKFPAGKLFKSKFAREMFKGLLQLGGEMLGEGGGELARQVATGEERDILGAAYEGLQTTGQSIASIGGLKAFEDLRVAKALEAINKDMGPGVSAAMFGGVRARTADLGNRDKAVQRTQAGEDPERVRRETGWFQDEQGDWRFEIDDSRMFVREPLLRGLPIADSRNPTPNQALPLEDIVSHPKLFAAYPTLRNVPVYRADFEAEGSQSLGEFVHPPIGPMLLVDKNLGGEDLTSTIVHELQHAVQYEEGFLGPSADAIQRTPYAYAPEPLLRKVAAKQLFSLTFTIPSLDQTWRILSNNPISSIIDPTVESDITNDLQDITFLIQGTTSQNIATQFRQIEARWEKIRRILTQTLYSTGLDPLAAIKLPKVGEFFINGLLPPSDARALYGLLKDNTEVIVAQQRQARDFINRAFQSGDVRGLRQILPYLDDFSGYEALFHEVEARDVQARRRMTEEERKLIPPFSSQDSRVPSDQRIHSRGPRSNVPSLPGSQTGAPPTPSRSLEQGSPLTRLVSRAEEHPFRQKDVEVARDSEWNAYRRLVERAVTKGIEEGLVDESVLEQLEEADSFWYSGDKGRATTFIDDALRQVHRGNEAQTHAMMLEGLPPEEVEAILAEIDPQDAERIRRALGQKDRSTIEQTSEEEGTDLSQFRAQGFIGGKFFDMSIFPPYIGESIIDLENAKGEEAFESARREALSLVISLRQHLLGSLPTEENRVQLADLTELKRALEEAIPEEFARPERSIPFDESKVPDFLRSSFHRLRIAENESQFEARKSWLQGEIRGQLRGIENHIRPRYEEEIANLQKAQKEGKFSLGRSDRLARKQTQLEHLEERINNLLDLQNVIENLTFEDLQRSEGGPDLSQFRSMGFDPGDRFRDMRRPGGEGDLPPRRAPSDDELAELAGVSKAIIARTREKLNLQQIPEPKVKGHAVALQSAIQKGIPDKALEIASRVQAAPRTLSQEEVVGLALAVAKLEQRHDELMSRAELMVDAGDTRTANGYKELADQLIEQIDAIELGARAGITEVARALAAVGSAFDTQTLTLSRVRRNAKVSRGRPLTEREEAQIRDAVRKLREAEQREKEALAKLEQAESQALQRLAEKALIAKAKEAQRQAKAENRAQKLEQVRKEREEILKQLRNKGFNIQSAGLDPEVAWLIAKLANTYIQEGIIGLDALVNKVLDHLPELSRDDVMEGVAMMNQQSEKEVRQQVIEKVEELKETNDLLEAVERLRKKDPKKAEQMLNQIHNFAAKTMTEDERLLEVEKQIQAIRTKLQAGVPPPKERRPQAPASPELQAKLDELRDLKRLLRLEQKIADLQQQLDTGIFKETPKKKAATVTPATEELKRAQVRLAQARRAVRVLTKGPTPFQKRDVVLEPIRLIRQLITTGEMSTTLRQGLGMIMAQPSKLPKHFATAFAAFFKSDVADEVEFMIQTSKWQPILQEMGVEFTYRQGLNEREELFMSKLLERTPAMKELLQDNHPAVKKLLLAGPASVKSIVNAAERHMTTFLNLYRMSIATQAIEQFGTEDMGTLKQLGKLINDLSGRGNFEMGPGSFASIIAFAPRFTVSRFSAPVRSAMALANPKLRRLAIAGFLRTAIWGASWFAFASMLGASIGSDPEDTDFGKIIFGNTRIDVWGGFQQPYSWLLRLALIGYKNWAEKPDEPVPDAYDMITRFALYKASPAVTFTATLLAKKTPVGEDVSSLGIIGSNTVPLFLQDAYETGKREGVLAGAGVAVGTGLGLNIQTWGSEMEAGDIKPIFKKAKYKPRPTQYPDEIKNNPDLKQRYDFIFGALVAKKVRENKSILDVSTPEQTKKLLQSWATEARATMKPYVDGKIENERTLQQLVEREDIVEEVR